MLAKNAGLKRSPLHPTDFAIPNDTTEELFKEWDADDDNLLSPLEVSNQRRCSLNSTKLEMKISLYFEKEFFLLFPCCISSQF